MKMYPYHSSHDYSVIVPVKNGGRRWREAALVLSDVVKPASRVIAIDSGSSDGSDRFAASLGFIVDSIPPESFSHGGTRQFAVDRHATGSAVVVFLTHDAVLANPHSISQLLESFRDNSVGCAYGRQIPHADADPFAAHAVSFNYPSEDSTYTWADRTTAGIKAAFLSNSFAAYRVNDLRTCGGFPDHLIAGEDVYIAMRMLQVGRAVRYCASAVVRHSHNTSLRQEMERNFDWGVMHAQIPDLIRYFGEPSKQGLQFLRSELAFLCENWPANLPRWGVRTVGKYAAYRLGRVYDRLPGNLCRKLSMTKGYWTTGRHSDA